MSASDGFISIKNVTKMFGTFTAVDNLSLEIGRGEFFSLLGSSGCGKTTLLRMLAGFETPNGGGIWIDGQQMTDVAPNERPVNMVFQNYAIFPHMNVRDNIAYGLRRQRLSREKRNEIVDEMLDLVQLPGYGDRKANELSGGQRQRVALARALILRPKVLLLDEPLGALDKQLREQMQLELRRLQRSVGITFVFVTHDQEEALTLSDRVAVMSDGKVMQVDSPNGLYERPRNRDVASFIGTMNFADAEVMSVAKNRATVVSESLGKLKIGTENGSLAKGDRVSLAIRPEKIELHKKAPSAGGISGSLEMTSYLGERSHFHVKVPGSETPLSVSAQNADLSHFDGLSEGAPVWLSWREGSIIVLENQQ